MLIIKFYIAQAAGLILAVPVFIETNNPIPAIISLIFQVIL